MKKIRIFLRKLRFNLFEKKNMVFLDTCPECGSRINYGKFFRLCHFCGYEDEYSAQNNKVERSIVRKSSPEKRKRFNEMMQRIDSRIEQEFKEGKRIKRENGGY